MKKKSHTKHPDDGAAQEQSDLMQVGPNGCVSDLQEIVGEFCQTLVGFYGKLRTFQTQIPKTPQR